MDILDGTAASVRVDFQTPYGMAIPEADTVVYSLFDHVGGGLITGQPVSVDPQATGVTIEIPDTLTNIMMGRDFEKRTLTVSWRSAGRSHTDIHRLRIIPLPPYSTEAQDVRTFFGYSSDELLDDEVDLYSAYLSLNQEIDLLPMLQSGTYREDLANEAIMLTAAVALIPSLRLRTPKENTSGTDTYSRFATTPDFDAIGAAALARLAEIKAEIGITVVSTTSPFLVAFSNPTDAITGV